MFSSLPFNYMFLIVMGVGTLFSVSSLHWLGIWAGLSNNLIGFFTLFGVPKKIMKKSISCKMFVVQAIGSSFLIFGSLLVYNMSFTWESVNNMYNTSILGLIMMVSGLSVKLGLFPFYFWLPSVMAGLPWITCLLLATWQKLGPIFLMISLLELSNSYWLIIIMCIMSSGSALMGGLGGMNQTQVRALLAYSSIGHLGWMLFALIHGEWVMKTYLLIYILISMCMFMSLWYSNSSIMKNFNNLKNSGFVQLSIMLMLLSLGGLPPLLGFISKWLVIMAGVTSPYLSFLFLLILGSLMSLFYYLSLFFSLILENMKGYSIVDYNSNFSSLLLIIILFNMLGGMLILFVNSLSVV
uniref:NADH-ubiquinone oxidoreductase chain 2 n=1 Tax=Galeodea echinophora TaxID=1665550 RepID=A0A0M3WMR4_GALEC|nr:NADH dehydrogenase subunit 2 [Galeodea echinophora]AKL90656.1 NADH dehydrogenase subunit 2 [Galeodea echinophora]